MIPWRWEVLDVASKAKARKKAVKKRQPKLFRPPVANIGESVAVEVKTTTENWSRYALADGTHLRVKPVVSVIRRSTEQYNPGGDPVYLIQAALVIQTDVPPKLKKRIKQS
jgi:hypothetical protein